MGVNVVGHNTAQQVAADGPATARIDVRLLDQLMNLSGELVIIRSQYARLVSLLQQDIARQKNISILSGQIRDSISLVARGTAHPDKKMAELKGMADKLFTLAGYEDAAGHIQTMAQTTGALEKTSSEIQSDIMAARAEAVAGGGKKLLSFSIIQALLVTIGEEVYAFPLEGVTEIINVPQKDIYSVDGTSTVKLREHALSLVELSAVIQVKPNKGETEERRVIIITDGEKRLGVLVDNIIGKDEIVIKALTMHFEHVKGIVGASILADGNVALILDPATIIKESR